MSRSEKLTKGKQGPSKTFPATALLKQFLYVFIQTSLSYPEMYNSHDQSYSKASKLRKVK